MFIVENCVLYITEIYKHNTTYNNSVDDSYIYNRYIINYNVI